MAKKGNGSYFVGGVIFVVILIVLFGGEGDMFTGKFTADKNITRGEFAKLMTETLGTNPDLSKYFACSQDIMGHPYENYICYITGTSQKLPGELPPPPGSEGIPQPMPQPMIKPMIMGFYADGTFQPDNFINRAEAAKMFIEAYSFVKKAGVPGVFLGPACPPPNQNSPYYTDVQNNQWFTTYVNYLSWYGIADVKACKNAKFYPGSNLTVKRAEYWAKNFKTAVAK